MVIIQSPFSVVYLEKYVKHVVVYLRVYVIVPLYQAFFTDEYTQQHPEDRDKLLRLKDFIAWQVTNTLTHVVQYRYTQPVSAHTMFVFIDPLTGWRNLSSREEGDRRPAAVPRANGGVFQTAEEESGEGVWSERAGEN